MKKKIFYWAPYLTKIATIKAVLNSLISLKKYGSEYEICLIDAVGEWSEHQSILEKYQVRVVRLSKYNLFKYLPKRGYFQSRISLIFQIIICFIPLLIILKKEKPIFFIAHLNTAIIMLLSNFFLKTKFILRISGYPKLHFMRKFIWSFFSKNLKLITCPTTETKNFLLKNNIFYKKKIFVLKDPILNFDDIFPLNQNKISSDKKIILAIGRLTKQKNFSFLIDCFHKITLKYPNEFKLIILGEGEKKKELSNLIKKLNLKDVRLEGYKSNVYDYYKSCFCFILSSLWEDPGFVLVEAAFANAPIISSNCPNGPSEFIGQNEAGYIYESNNSNSFLNTFDNFYNTPEKQKLNKKIIAKKKNKNVYKI
jgi:glycosyltransferase involved in cell wall biosynthesis